eukprot:CAMPEP_0206251986 /NCGR_PEP_ID=MMETSP0047_2-20121206/22324_1 /ASSEMBLY_ACC=CAM_ASM_000192 /TAXON_ID=195065 /ORGANISM="Chroomonas mesostigmatica_cf, Strain CCMP1168" /LENGTH=140 /DNA_ID=CAMNT_0053677991 /DNA_START=3 /DNA_END=421 /DNA_ORIENTATION=-
MTLCRHSSPRPHDPPRKKHSRNRAEGEGRGARCPPVAVVVEDAAFVHEDAAPALLGEEDAQREEIRRCVHLLLLVHCVAHGKHHLTGCPACARVAAPCVDLVGALARAVARGEVGDGLLVCAQRLRNALRLCREAQRRLA